MKLENFLQIGRVLFSDIISQLCFRGRKKARSVYFVLESKLYRYFMFRCYYRGENKLLEAQSPEGTYFTRERYFTRCVDRADSFRASFQSGTINRGIEQLRVYTARKYTLLNPLIVFAKFNRKESRPVYSNIRS